MAAAQKARLHVAGWDNKMSAIVKIQEILGVTPDGVWGPKSQAALDFLIRAYGVTTGYGWHQVKGSSFADPADVHAFKRCKANGGTDHECFKVGDNAIGAWGDDTSEGSGPSVALPPEDWKSFPTPNGKQVEVQYGDKTVVALLKDTMPHKANIKNGAGIDMNPDTCRALGLEPPVLTKVSWRWV
jgi:hypothetical protein